MLDCPTASDAPVSSPTEMPSSDKRDEGPELALSVISHARNDNAFGVKQTFMGGRGWVARLRMTPRRFWQLTIVRSLVAGSRRGAVETNQI